MPKLIIIFLILIVGLVGIYWLIAQPSELKPVTGLEPVISEEVEEQAVPEEEEEIVLEEEPLSDRARIFYVSGKGLPTFTKVIIDPCKEVKEGEKQSFSIWVKGPKGIEEVIATIGTDAEDELIELELVEGTDIEGKWRGSWITKNISANSHYSVVFQAVNKEGKEIKMPLTWFSQTK